MVVLAGAIGLSVEDTVDHWCRTLYTFLAEACRSCVVIFRCLIVAYWVARHYFVSIAYHVQRL